jgi:iron complex outermembrane receptor protein
VPLPEVVVSTARAGDRTPVAKSVLDRQQIVRANWGQDTPMALATLPGVYAYSDAGNDIGYSYLSIRGFPQRRISVLIDGVPLNDPESHEVYWIDHPDLLASTSEVQLQRGVGSALYGAASVGGSVNLETSPFAEERRATASVAYGSYNTRRYALEMNSGRLGGDWSYYGRYSRIETDGYRDQSDSELWSYYFSARKVLDRQSFRLNLYGGPEETHLAYDGVPPSYLRGEISGDRDRDRRFNPITYPGERDHFFEPHYELIHSWTLRAGATLSQTLFYFDGKGYYDEQRFNKSLSQYRLTPWATTDTTLFPAGYYRDDDGDGRPDLDAQGRATVERFDLVRKRWVENRHFGWIPRVRLEHPGGAVTFGGELRAHDGRHIGTVVSGSGLPPGTEPDHVYYDYHPRTLAGGLFMREEWNLASALRVTGDLAWRHQSYLMRGDRFDGIRFDQGYDFALPRAGLTWTPRADVNVFASWSYSSREPAFRTLYDAEGVGSVPLYRRLDIAAGIYEDPYVKPERVNDYEVGGSWGGKTVALAANLFRMGFRDELVDYQFNTDLGYFTPANAARSVHQGVELAARMERGPATGLRLELEANTSLSDNHFVSYEEALDPTTVVSHDGKAIPFFPATLGNAGARLHYKGLLLGVEVQHAGRMYLDPNEDKQASIVPHNVLNLVSGYRLSLPGVQEAALSLRVFNALDRRYEVAGYMDSDAAGNWVPHDIPAATRHVLGELRVVF